MTDLRGALIGCGFFAVNQLHGWRDAKGGGLVAICDRDPARLKLVGDQFGIERRYTDAREMLATETARLRRHRHDRREPPSAGRTDAVAQTADDLPEALCADARRRQGHGRRRPRGRCAADGAREFPLAVADPGGQGHHRQRRDRHALFRARLVPVGLRRLCRPALPRQGQALHRRRSRRSCARRRALSVRRRRRR